MILKPESLHGENVIGNGLLLIGLVILGMFDFPRKEAFTSLNNGGYLEGKILGKYYKAHRVIWLWMTGEWPKEQVDHINHDRTDNRWCNLREASRLENYRNQSQYKNNKSGLYRSLQTRIKMVHADCG